MIIHCKQCSNRCCLKVELDGDETVVKAYRIVPGKPVPERKQVPHCRNVVKLLGMRRDEVLVICGGGQSS